MKMGKKLVSIMICLGLLLIGCALDAGDNMGTLSDGSIPVVSENAGEAQTEILEINATTADESEVEGSEISASGVEETQTQVPVETGEQETIQIEQNDAYKLFYGTWEITQVVERRKWPEDWDSRFDAEHYQDILGMQVTYGPDVYEFGDVVRVENPDYLISIYHTGTPWAEHFTAPSSFVPEEEYFVWVDIYNFPIGMETGLSYDYEPCVGSSFFIKDDNTLYCYAYDRFYEMKRVGWLGDEPEEEDEEENEANEGERRIIYTQNEVYKMFYGTWEISSVVSRHRSQGGVEGYEDVIGTEVTYRAKAYCIGDEIMVNDPAYQMYIMPMSPATLSCQERNLYSLLPGAAYYVWVEIANLPADSGNGETLGLDPNVGSMFFLKNENTMYCVNNNCIYEMTRLEDISYDFSLYFGPGWNTVEY